MIRDPDQVEVIRKICGSQHLELCVFISCWNNILLILFRDLDSQAFQDILTDCEYPLGFGIVSASRVFFFLAGFPKLRLRLHSARHPTGMLKKKIKHGKNEGGGYVDVFVAGPFPRQNLTSLILTGDGDRHSAE
ncbi:hypothetical protein ACFE04_008348 [Oxalis oulophora]